MELPPILVRILAAWAGLGTLIFSGVIPVPEGIRVFFGPELIDGVRQFIGAVIVFISVLKAAKIVKGNDAEINTMSRSNQIWYVVKPW